MSHFRDHCDDCAILIGKEWADVHKWLDAFYRTEGKTHRRHRHHTEGVETIREMWGDEAALAAQIHILADCWGLPGTTDYELGVVDEYGYSAGATSGEARMMLKEILKKHKNA